MCTRLCGYISTSTNNSIVGHWSGPAGCFQINNVGKILGKVNLIKNGDNIFKNSTNYKIHITYNTYWQIHLDSKVSSNKDLGEIEWILLGKLQPIPCRSYIPSYAIRHGSGCGPYSGLGCGPNSGLGCGPYSSRNYCSCQVPCQVPCQCSCRGPCQCSCRGPCQVPCQSSCQEAPICEYIASPDT